MATRKATNKRRSGENATYRGDRERSRDDGRMDTIYHDLSVEATNAGVTIANPVSQYPSAYEYENGNKRTIVLRLLPCLDEESGKLLPPVIEDRGEVSATAWFESVWRAGFGAGSQRHYHILFDSLSDTYAQATDWRSINPYGVLHMVADRDKTFKPLCRKQADAGIYRPILSRPVHYAIVQGWVVRDGNTKPNPDNDPSSLKEFLLRKPTLIYLPSQILDSIISEVLDSYNRRKLIESGEDKAQFEGMVCTKNFTGLKPGFFVKITQTPQKGDRSNDYYYWQNRVRLVSKAQLQIRDKDAINVTASVNDQHTAEALQSRWQFWGDVLNFPQDSDRVLANSVASSLVDDPMACACLEQAWSETHFFDYLDKELVEKIGNQAHEYRQGILRDEEVRTSSPPGDELDDDYGEHDLMGASRGKASANGAEEEPVDEAEFDDSALDDLLGDENEGFEDEETEAPKKKTVKKTVKKGTKKKKAKAAE